MKKITKKNRIMTSIESREGDLLEETLRKKFVDENKSTQQIADDLQVSYLTAYRWLQKAGIYSRKLKL